MTNVLGVLAVFAPLLSANQLKAHSPTPRQGKMEKNELTQET